MLVMFYRYTKKPIWCFRGNQFDFLGISGVVRCNCHNLNRSWRFFNITSMTLIRRWVMRRLTWVWNDFLFHWHDAAEVDGRRLLYINVLSNKLTHNIHVSKRVRVDLGTSWLGYELTKKSTSWLGYELTWVRVDQKPSRSWVTTSPDLGPLVHTVCSVSLTSHFQKNETGACVKVWCRNVRIPSVFLLVYRCTPF